jgi:hypothetical protein
MSPVLLFSLTLTLSPLMLSSKTLTLIRSLLVIPFCLASPRASHHPY